MQKPNYAMGGFGPVGLAYDAMAYVGKCEQGLAVKAR